VGSNLRTWSVNRAPRRILHPAQDAPRVEVDLVHDAAAVWRGLNAEDALRALVLYEPQGIVCRVRIEELVALLGEVGNVIVLDQASEGLVEEEIHLVRLEDVMGLQHVAEGVLDPEPVQGLSEVLETQCTLGVRCWSAPGCGGAAPGHPVCHAAYSVDVWTLLVNDLKYEQVLTRRVSLCP
jgi:hypothetical protein